jgi:hypothetical protein
MFEMWMNLSKEMGFDPNISGQSGLDQIVSKSGMLAKLIRPINNIEAALEAVHGRIIRMMVNLVGDNSLRVRGHYTTDDETHAFSHDIIGSKLKGMEYAKVTIRPRFPYEELQNVVAAQGIVTSELGSRARVMSKYLGIDDAERERDQIKREKAEDHPVWLDTMAQLVAQKLATVMAPPPTPQDPSMMMNQAQQAQIEGLAQGGTPQNQMNMMLNGPPSPSGNMEGMPSPNISTNQLLKQQGPGRPPG